MLKFIKFKKFYENIIKNLVYKYLIYFFTKIIFVIIKKYYLFLKYYYLYLLIFKDNYKYFLIKIPQNINRNHK